MTLIELGEVSPGSTAPEPPAPPLTGRHLRRYAAAVVTVLCLLVLAGAQRPESRTLRVLWTASGEGTENFMMTDQSLYVLGSPARAYDAATGRVRWTVPGTSLHTWVYDEAGGVTLMPGGVEERRGTNPDGTSYHEEQVTHTVALDTATGAQRWRHPGEWAWTAEDATLLAQWDFRGRGLLSVRVVRLSDGHTVWSWAPSEPVHHWTLTGMPGQPAAVVTATGDGRIEVRRFADGTVSARGRVPWVPNRESDGAFTDLTAHDGTLFVARSEAGRTSVDAYRQDTLAHLWAATSARYTGISGCGPLVCLGVEPGPGLVGRDPRTGAVRWRIENWDNAQPLPDGRLLLTAGHTGGNAVADAATGRILADLGTRPAVVDHGNGGTVVTLTPTRNPVGGTAVHEVVAPGRRVLRGMLTGNTTGCQVGGHRLACVDAGVLTVRAVG